MNVRLKLDSGIVASFSKLSMAGAKDGCHSVSDDGRYVLKVQFTHFETKANDISKEVEILRYLMDHGCVTSPKLLGYGQVSKEVVVETVTENGLRLNSEIEAASFPYMIMPRYVETDVVYTPDILMAIIEQKKLGVWHGDIHTANMLFDPDTKCIKLIDYDQAIYLTEEQRNLPNLEFFEFIDREQRDRFGRYGVTGWLHNFSNVKWDVHFMPFFEKGSFDLGSTYLFKNSETTLRQSKIYHSFDTPDFFSKGERVLNDRTDILDQIEFESGERVLDIGCNAGLLCHYLLSRACTVWGIDIDPAVIAGAKIIANIMGKKGIEFECLDIDHGGPLGYFDTIMLFSVIHHTSRINENAERISKLCNRIIIEARLREQGAKPVNGKWVATTVWKHDTLDDLIAGLESLFPGFKHTMTLGQGDRDRYVMEFCKAAA